MIFDKEPRDTAINFELYISSDDSKYDLPKVGKHMVLGDYVSNIPTLIKSLDEDDHMLLSFPDNTLKVNIIDNNKYICISSAFESEFDLLYSDFKSNKNKNYNKAKATTIKYLSDQVKNKQNNSQTRKYYNSFIKYIGNFEGRLEEQIAHVFQLYSYIVEPERKYYKNEHPEINFDNSSLAKAFADKRNNLSHGSKLEKFKTLEVASYIIVRKINYAMILERSGFNKKQIQEIINQVF